MKKILFFAVTIIALQAQAKIWRVNNNPSIAADVLQASTLFDGTNNATNPEAASGDSVYFEPSASVYNGFNVNKTNIVIIGYGYMLTANPGMQAMSNNARVQDISFLSTSTGSSVMGMEISDGAYIYSGNITISRCNTNYVYLYNTTNATGIRIDKCYIKQAINDAGVAGTVTNITVAVENCIFSGIGDGNNITGVSYSNKIRGLFRNNTMNYCGQFYAFNFYVANNIFISQTNFGTVSSSGNNVFRNNLFSHPIANSQYAQVGGNTAPNSNNLFSVNMANVFNGNTDNVFNVGSNTYNNYILIGAFTPESRLELKSGSTAIAAGETGLTVGSSPVTTPNCGAFGATDPYRKGGFPNIPRIYSLTIPATVPNGAANMNISISSSSNN